MSDQCLGAVDYAVWCLTCLGAVDYALSNV